MIKILHVDDVPMMGNKISKVRIVMDEALDALEKNPGKVIHVSRDDGKVLASTMAKKYVPEGVRVFQRGKDIFLKKEKN